MYTSKQNETSTSVKIRIGVFYVSDSQTVCRDTLTCRQELLDVPRGI
jgi:hypothetical protein